MEEVNPELIYRFGCVHDAHHDTMRLDQSPSPKYSFCGESNFCGAQVIRHGQAHWNKVELNFSRPGKPTDNAFIEAFNSRLRQECLNAAWFLSLADAQEEIEVWRKDYN